MQNIESILKEFGVEIAADQAENFRKKFHENYKTATEHEKLKADLSNMTQRAETAEATLKGFEGIDPDKIQGEVAEWKKKAEEAEKNFQNQLFQRDFDDALKTHMDSIEFTSAAARKAIEAEVRANCNKIKDGKIIGFTDVIEAAKKADATAFVDKEQEAANQNKAKFTTKSNSSTAQPGTMTRDEIMNIKDRSERRAAIAAHMNLFNKGE